MMQDFIKKGQYSVSGVLLLNNETIISFYSTQSDLEALININPNLAYVNLKDCKELLISNNKLEEKSEYLILGIETKNNPEISPKNNFTYEVYTTTGEKITDLSICENSSLEISFPLINLDMINYDEALLIY